MKNVLAPVYQILDVIGPILGFELEKEYFELACKRIANAKAEKESKFAFC